MADQDPDPGPSDSGDGDLHRLGCEPRALQRNDAGPHGGQGSHHANRGNCSTSQCLPTGNGIKTKTLVSDSLSSFLGDSHNHSHNSPKKADPLQLIPPTTLLAQKQKSSIVKQSGDVISHEEVSDTTQCRQPGGTATGHDGLWVDDFAVSVPQLPFDLTKQPDALEEPSNRALLEAIFPGNRGLATDGKFLYFFQEEFPPRPWPRMIAGLPIFITISEAPQGAPIPHALPANSTVSIAEEIDGTDPRLFPILAQKVVDYFEENEIEITEVMGMTSFLTIVLVEMPINHGHLLWLAGGVLCRYLLEKDMQRPLDRSCRRAMDPTAGHPDNGPYYTLRPGIRVTSECLPETEGKYLSTTAGVLVTDGEHEYMTVASHGFPRGVGSHVFHSDPSSHQTIGIVEKVLADTGISLVRLLPSETFDNLTFATANSAPVRLNCLRPMGGRASSFPILIDAPDTGLLEGVFELFSYQRIPTDEPGPKMKWVWTTWVYLGQTNDTSLSSLPNTIRGSAMWTPAGDVIGFFWYAPKSGVMKDWCAGIAASELVDAGLSLVKTEDAQGAHGTNPAFGDHQYGPY